MDIGPIFVIGMGADGPPSLRPEQIERIRSADFLAGGERHLRFFPEARAERFVIGDNLFKLAGELGKRCATQQCVVLASGDPLFYGIGGYLVGLMGRELFCFEPALSSMQLAFARAAVPWQQAALASIHGRSLRNTLLPLLGQKSIGLFTQDGDSPAAVAHFLLQRGLDDYQAIVCENLGGREERVTVWNSLEDLADQRFSPLNYLILLRRRAHSAERAQCRGPGIPDEEFSRPERAAEVMTRQEVRSVLLGKLCPGKTAPGDTVWDIGAGLGTVSVEIAILRPDAEVVAVERDPNRLPFLRQNRERFDAYNIRIIEGTAPEALKDETERPRIVFIGGSGQQLSEILDFTAARLHDGGGLLANFVTLENLTLMLQRVRHWGWGFEVTELHLSRSDSLAGHTGLKPQRGVFIVRADKPEATSD